MGIEFCATTENAASYESQHKGPNLLLSIQLPLYSLKQIRIPWLTKINLTQYTPAMSQWEFGKELGFDYTAGQMTNIETFLSINIYIAAGS